MYWPLATHALTGRHESFGRDGDAHNSAHDELGENLRGVIKAVSLDILDVQVLVVVRHGHLVDGVRGV